MIKGKTSTGFEYTIADEARDDMELLEAFMDIDNGKVSGLKSVIEQLLGKDQKAALYDHLRNKETGRVRASEVMAAIGEILTNAGEQDNAVKN